MGDGLSDEFLLGVAELRISVLAVVADECVRELVAGNVDLRVDRLIRVDRQDLRARVARATVTLGERLVDDRVAELVGELLERVDRPREGVALYGGDRRIQWLGLGRRRQRLDPARR
jgi:hypothetical protein